ncbi:MAG TPA: nuclear transport factor 2 family protein [Candidatus Thermoplasmatota archaeon]|nr:nuclear transport factor 2 family protein [Candidatus Thermoplasmatota archaeon]
MQRSELCPLTDSPASVYERWKAALESKDVDGLASLYHRDCQVLGFDMQIKGPDELVDALRVPMRFLGSIRIHDGPRHAAAGDSILQELTLESRMGKMRATHAFVVQSGLIRHHFIGNVHRDPGTHAAK